jgi:hypothetical protein
VRDIDRTGEVSQGAGRSSSARWRFRRPVEEPPDVPFRALPSAERAWHSGCAFDALVAVRTGLAQVD